MNYLPFDLETALKHPERVVTRDGRKVEQIHFFKIDNPCAHPIYGIINDKVEHWNDNGIYSKGCVTNNDLFLLPEIKECWVNVYEGEHSIWLSGCFDTESYARQSGKISGTYLKTIRITNEPE